MTNDQARQIYKKLEPESIVNIDTIKQEIEADKLGSNNIDKDKVNTYHEIITNKTDKENIITSEMELWSILSNIINYVQYDRYPKIFSDLDVKTINQKSHHKIYYRFMEEDRQILELDFGNTPEKIKRRFFRYV